jgi:phenylacetic acid degradation operon negative regulatory protein
MLFDLFGDFASEAGRRGAIRLTAIVRLGTSLGLSAVAVRAAAGRMLQDGWLQAARQGRESELSLTSNGRRLVDEGRTRIFAPDDEPWDGSWYLVALSVPEAHRDVRDRMRQELSWLGFGSPSSALYISPRDHRRAVVRLAEQLDATEYLQVYHGSALAPADPRALVARAWGDLQPVNRRYAEFIRAFQPRQAGVRAALASGAFEESDALWLRFALVNQFRKCLFDDPVLPAELLPGSWAGSAARRLFLEFHTLVTPAALAYFDRVCGPTVARQTRTPRRPKRGECTDVPQPAGAAGR